MKKHFLLFFIALFTMFTSVVQVKAEDITSSLKISQEAIKYDENTVKTIITFENTSDKVINEVAFYYSFTPTEKSFYNTNINNVDYKWSVSSDDLTKGYVGFLNMKPGDKESIEKLIYINEETKEIKFTYSVSDELYTKETNSIEPFYELLENKSIDDFLATGESSVKSLTVSKKDIKGVSEETVNEEVIDEVTTEKKEKENNNFIKIALISLVFIIISLLSFVVMKILKK